MGANNCGAARDDYGYLEKDISSEYHTYHTLKRRAVFLRRNTMDQVRCRRAGNYRVYTGAVPIAVRPDGVLTSTGRASWEFCADSGQQVPGPARLPGIVLPPF